MEGEAPAEPRTGIGRDDEETTRTKSCLLKGYWEHVRNNPVRYGLVKRAQDWPFQCKIYKLVWM